MSDNSENEVDYMMSGQQRVRAMGGTIPVGYNNQQRGKCSNIRRKWISIHNSQFLHRPP